MAPRNPYPPGGPGGIPGIPVGSLIAEALAQSGRRRRVPSGLSAFGLGIAGVCAGFAEYFDIDVTIVRVVWLIAAVFGGGGVLAYVIAWIIMPQAPAAAMVPAAPAPQPYHQ